MKYDYLLHHLFARSLELFPDKPSVGDNQCLLTFSELAKKAGGVIKRLQQISLEKGERVAFFLEHDVNQAVSILAISVAGGVFVPINALLFPQQVVHILQDSGARALITTRARGQLLDEALSIHNRDMEIIFIEDIDSEGNIERTCFAIENDLTAILYTSGSSGQPKGVMISHKNLVSGCWIISEYLGLDSNDRLLGVLPLSFDYGLNQLITMWAHGGFYQFQTFKLPNEIVDALVKYNITGFAGIPPIWAILVRSSLCRTKLLHLKYITNSGGAVPTTIVNKLKEYLPQTKMFLMYGLTEAFRSTYLPPEQLENHITSIGKAIPNTEIMILSPNGQRCKPRETGELVHRGPTVSLGYWKRPDDNEKRFRPWPLGADPKTCMERVVFSGDLAYSDEEGYLFFVGRNDAMIKCSGNRISPSEIEEVVHQTGLVKQVAAIGVPDTAAGQVIKIFVVLTDELKFQTEGAKKQIVDYCSKKMPAYMCPRFVECVEELPRTATGKIDYPLLQKRGQK